MMDSLLSGISQHGYAILFLVVFLEAIGIPVPAALALLLAGGASVRGPLRLEIAAAIALAALALGDTLMYLAGRFTGWWLLTVLCRLSLNPESCILRSADAFYKRGRMVLLFAKFVPGINTMAPPLAGSMNMRFSQFLGLDLIGASLYAGAYLGVGFLFSGILGRITSGLQSFGRVLSWMIAAAIAIYLGYQVRLWIKARVFRSVPRVSAAQVARRLYSPEGGGVAVYDVRSHGYYDAGAMRIRQSSRLEPNAMNQMAQALPAGTEVFVYCTCIREATSARVAHLLIERGVRCSVIEGGLRAWKKAGLPIEPVPVEDVVALPSFAS